MRLRVPFFFVGWPPDAQYPDITELAATGGRQARTPQISLHKPLRLNLEPSFACVVIMNCTSQIPPSKLASADHSLGVAFTGKAYS